ncbi:MAG: NADH-ubiquinone oxidoreductase-F iron-sulfur binding region domain-containing protein [Propionibacteriaceae bacterium]
MIVNDSRRVDLARTDPRAVLGLLHAANLRGHGGAGFPTATKIESAQGRRPRLIVNACDGEPLVHKDITVLRHAAGLLADGAALVASMVQAFEVVIAVHTTAVLDAERIAAQLGPSARVLTVPDRYVASEGSALASLAAGGRARPFTHLLPLTHGGLSRGNVATLVLNAETVARVAALWLDAAEGRAGSAPPARLVTLAGAVRRPGVVEATVDTRVGALVEAAGAPTTRRAVLVGGYGGRWLSWADAAPTSLADLGPDLGAGLIMVQGADCPLRVVGSILAYLAAQSAGQCGPCAFGLPAIAADWAELAHPATAPAAHQRLRRRLPVVEGRGACSHPDGAVRMASSALAVFGAHGRGHAHGRCHHPDDEATPPIVLDHPRLRLEPAR